MPVLFGNLTLPKVAGLAPIAIACADAVDINVGDIVSWVVPPVSIRTLPAVVVPVPEVSARLPPVDVVPVSFCA